MYKIDESHGCRAEPPSMGLLGQLKDLRYIKHLEEYMA